MRPPAAMKHILTRDQLRLIQTDMGTTSRKPDGAGCVRHCPVDLLNNDVRFRATGSQVKFEGFMKVYVEGDDDKKEEKDRILPPLEKGEKINYEEIDPKQHFTQPPPRYTEERLVKTLEELGIGRRLTFGPTLDTIQRRGYVTLDAISVLSLLS